MADETRDLRDTEPVADPNQDNLATAHQDALGTIFAHEEPDTESEASSGDQDRHSSNGAKGRRSSHRISIPWKDYRAITGKKGKKQPQTWKKEDITVGSLITNRLQPTRDALIATAMPAIEIVCESRDYMKEWSAERSISYSGKTNFVAMETRTEERYDFYVTSPKMYQARGDELIFEELKAAPSIRSKLLDCYSQDRTIYFITGYITTTCLRIACKASKSRHLEVGRDGRLWTFDTGGNPDEQVLEYGYPDERVFGVILRQVQFRSGRLLEGARLGNERISLALEKIKSKDQTPVAGSGGRLEVALDDW